MLMDNVTLEKLREKHGAKADGMFKNIADAGGWGKVDPEYRGGLDIKGMKLAGDDPGNPAAADCKKRYEEIQKILKEK